MSTFLKQQLVSLGKRKEAAEKKAEKMARDLTYQRSVVNELQSEIERTRSALASEVSDGE